MGMDVESELAFIFQELAANEDAAVLRDRLGRMIRSTGWQLNVVPFCQELMQDRAEMFSQVYTAKLNTCLNRHCMNIVIGHSVSLISLFYRIWQ